MICSNNPQIILSWFTDGNVANGPPTGAENCSETEDPGFSATTKLVPIRSFWREGLLSVAAKGPSFEY